MLKAQSAMEYLMTYGWAVLIVAVVIIALANAGVFNSGQFFGGSSCLPIEGFSCTQPTLQSNGWLSASVGTFPLSMTMVQTGCSNNTTLPTSWTVPQGNVASGGLGTFIFPCSLSSNAIGTKFTGKLWVKYVQNGQIMTSLVGSVATRVASNSQTGLIPYTYTGSTTTTTGTTNSITLQPGAPWYICFASTSNGMTSYSGTADLYSNSIYMGHQTSNVCSVTQSPAGQIALAGIAVNYPTYTLMTWGSTSVNPILFSYNVGDTGQTTFIAITQITNSVISANFPVGCTTLENQESTNGGFVYLASCSGQIPGGPYTVSVTANGLAAAVWGVYSFG